MSDSHVAQMAPIARRYEQEHLGDDVHEPDRLHAEGLTQIRSGQIGLLRDLQDLYVLATFIQTTWTVLAQGAQGLRDDELLHVATNANSETTAATRLAQHPHESSSPPSLDRRRRRCHPRSLPTMGR